MKIHHIIKSENIEKMLEEINKNIENPNLKMTKETFLRILEKTPQNCSYVLEARKNKSLEAVLKSQPPKLDVSKMPITHLLGITISPSCFEAYDTPVEVAAAALAKNYTALQQSRYNHNQLCAKRKRANRRKDIEAGTPRRMDFLWEVLRNKGLATATAIAKKSGYTKQNIDYIKYTDDLRISIIQKLLGTAKLRAQIKLESNKTKPRQATTTHIRKHYTKYPSQAKWKASGGCLDCLARVIIESGLPLRTFCNRYGLSYYLIYFTMQRDDIALSELEKIAKAIDSELIIDIIDQE